MKCLLMTSLSMLVALGLSATASAQFGNQEPAQQPQQQPRQAQPGQPQAAQPQRTVVATVNGEPITRSEVQASLQAQGQGQAAPGGQQEVLDTLIESRLVEQHAIEQGPEVQSQEVEAVMDQFQQQLQAQGTSLPEFLATRGYTEDGFQKRIKGGLAWRKYQQEEMSDEKLQQVYQQNQEQFGGASFEQARPQVMQVYATQLWNEVVQEERPKAEIEMTGGQPQQSPNQPSSRFPVPNQ